LGYISRSEKKEYYRSDEIHGSLEIDIKKTVMFLGGNSY
jgi:hypothetical protein